MQVEGTAARLYVAALMRTAGSNVDSRRIAGDAVRGGRRALNRLRLACVPRRFPVGRCQTPAPAGYRRRDGRPRVCRRGPATTRPAPVRRPAAA